MRFGLEFGRGLGPIAVAAVACCMISAAAIAAEAPVYKNPKAPLEARVDDLLGRLTLQEKVSLTAGGSAFGTAAIPQLGIPAIEFSDGPNGLRSNAGDKTTAFPTGVAMAATWDPALVQRLGAAIGEEALAKGIRVMLGPNVNIQRTPLAGRNFESYSEDPLLAGEIGAGWVRGVQSKGVGTSLKHFAANNQEFERQRSSSDMDERTLREIYLPAFEHVVKEAHPWTVMASYNRLNGVYASENPHLMRDILKGEWHYDGVVMSDWGATHSTVDAAKAGLDLEMPGPGQYLGTRLLPAVRDWQVPEADIDDSARRMLRLILRTGVMDGKPLPKGQVNSGAHQDIAREVAEQSTVLLKNDATVLPFDKSVIKTVAVIGPNADQPAIGGGGSAQVTPYHILTPLGAIEAYFGNDAKVTYIPGATNTPAPPIADARLFSPAEGRTAEGLTARYFKGSEAKGKPVKQEVDTSLLKLGFGNDVAAKTGGAFTVQWQGYFWPPRDGSYEFSLVSASGGTLTIDDTTVIGDKTPGEASPIMNFLPVKMHRGSIALKAGQAYPVTLTMQAGAGYRAMALGLQSPTGTIEEAAKAAHDSDIAIVVVGSSPTTETEGRDRTSMDLYGRQNALVDAVLDANPNTVVVVNVGAPVTMPWINKARAVLLQLFPGQEDGEALANVLFGEVNPSGHLPETFPMRLEDNPAYLFYPGTRHATYGEGVFVGYRYYDTKKIEPLFPFGYGLSYTHFGLKDAAVSASKDTDKPVDVAVTITNDGKRDGADVVQLYIHDAEASVPRPFQELKGFRKVKLKRGESQTVHFALGPRAFSFYDEDTHGWVCEPGAFTARIGDSSRDIRLEKRFTLDADCRLAAR